MKSSIALGAGGPRYHPDEPFAFHPALHAAGHLLRRGEEIQPGLASDFRAELLHPELLGRPHRRLLADLVAWAEPRHLASPYVLELLYLTTLTWFAALRRLELLEADACSLSLDHPDPSQVADRCRELLVGWGPWIDLVTGDPDEVRVDVLIDLAAPIHHLVPPQRVRNAEGLVIEVPAWRPEAESWEAAEERLRDEFEATLRAHRSEVDALAERTGLLHVPVKTAHHHFDWFAQRQLLGLRPSGIAERSGVAVSTVHAGLAQLSALLELPLRPVKSGPEPW